MNAIPRLATWRADRCDVDTIKEHTRNQSRHCHVALCRPFATSADFVQPVYQFAVDIAEPPSTVVRYNKGVLAGNGSDRATRSVKAALREARRVLPGSRFGGQVMPRPRTGRYLYVVIALNGAGPALGNEIDPFCRRRSGCGSGVWVLRESEVSQLLRKADDELASGASRISGVSQP